jgi:hypothetical protein
MSSVDYTPVLLAQLTDLQMRITKLESMNATLTSEVERLSGKPVITDPTMRTSVPLRPKPMSDFKTQSNTRGARVQSRVPRDDARAPRSRPKVATERDTKRQGERPTMSLSDVLHSGEEVTIQVGTGKDEEGNFTYTTASSTFDGTELTVTECELVDSLVGMKSAKPGEILYKFIDELKSAGHIKRTFTIAPWKLCFVERDGNRMSLEELRTVVG